jgi:hypothetical protein
VDVGDVDDAAAALFQFGRGGLRQEQGRDQVAAHQVVPVLHGDGADRGRIEARRVVDQHVEPAEGGDGLVDQARQTVDVEQVGLDQRHRIGPDGVQLVLQRARLVDRTAVVDHQVGAAGMQQAAGCRAHPFGPAGYQYDFALHRDSPL